MNNIKFNFLISNLNFYTNSVIQKILIHIRKFPEQFSLYLMTKCLFLNNAHVAILNIWFKPEISELNYTKTENAGGNISYICKKSDAFYSTNRSIIGVSYK